MSDPLDLAGLSDEEGGGDPVLAGWFHPVVGHVTVVIDGDGVLHRAVLAGDKVADLLLAFGLRFFALPDRGTHKLDLVLLVFLLHFGQMRNLGNAWSAPRGPELHDIHIAWLELLDGCAIEVLGDLDGGGLVADGQDLLLLLGFLSGGVWMLGMVPGVFRVFRVFGMIWVIRMILSHGAGGEGEGQSGHDRSEMSHGLSFRGVVLISPETISDQSNAGLWVRLQTASGVPDRRSRAQ